MRQIINHLDLLHNQCFAVWFLMNNFPEGLEVYDDCSIAEMIAENCSIDKIWADELTGYYEGVFDQGDGYVMAPKTVKLNLAAGIPFFIEFHPGDTLYYIGRDMIGCTGPDYSIRKIELSQFAEYTKEMDDKEKIFMLPMLKASNDERESVTKLITVILDKFELQKCDPDKICECILENCIDS